jgi:glycosyltransferase involved in cell wall biosynthesis
LHILIIHNNYGVYTGEETVVDRQIALFTANGFTVRTYRKTTEGARGTWLGNIRGLLQGFYSPASVRDIRQIMQNDRPDVAIVHNLYPYISPAILTSIKKAGVPIVMTVHNYRLICPTGLFMRNCQPCELCLTKNSEWPCIRYNCEHSILKSIGYAARNYCARQTKAYLNNIDVFACITRFQMQKLTQAGYDHRKMVHIPNFLEKIETPNYTSGSYVAISGRLSKEKGIDLALEVASKTPEINYVFAGSPRAEEPISRPIPNNCVFLGHVSGEQLADFYRNARFLLNQSRCYEGFPMTILEAASYGKPAIAPNHAGFPEIIDDNKSGLLFTPNDAKSLQEKISHLWNSPDLCLNMGKQAYDRLINRYTSQLVMNQWQAVFDRLLE